MKLVKLSAIALSASLVACASTQKTEAPKVDDKKAAMLLRMEKMRAAKGKNKNLPAVEKVTSVPVAKEEKMVSAASSSGEIGKQSISQHEQRLFWRKKLGLDLPVFYFSISTGWFTKI